MSPSPTSPPSNDLEKFLARAPARVGNSDPTRLAHWEQEIISMLDCGRYRFAEEFLYSVLYCVQDDQFITDAQIRGVTNVKNSVYGRKKRR